MKEQKISFYKMHGSGNDFILFDLRKVQIKLEDMPNWAKKLCRRGFGIGADGLIFLEPQEGEQVSYRWYFFNADGSRAEMCGNGSRCAAWLAHYLGLAEKEHFFLTDAGVIKAEIVNEDEVKVQLTTPFDLKLNFTLDVNEEEIVAHSVNTGVPHCVIFRDDLENFAVKEIGRKIRFHKHFEPAGTNVNFAKVIDKNKILLRTYERGVEDETYACGTGASATAYIAFNLDKVGNKVEIITSGKEKLTIYLEEDNIFLQGKAILVYEGVLNNKVLFS